MPSPKNKKDVQRFLGMITFLNKFIDNLSEKSAILRELLKNDTEFVWLEHHERAFNVLKQILIKKPILKYFEPSKTVTISVDASSKGMGAVLLQENKPCAFSSRALTPTQMRYAQIEKELLAVCFGTQKFAQYVYGKSFTVETDHKPLISIFKKNLNDCPIRLQRMLLSLQKYDINIVYKPGKHLIIADTLSRANLDIEFEEKMDLEAQVWLLTKNINMTDKKLKELQIETEKDEQLKQLKEYIIKGWPNTLKKVKENVKFYYKFKNELTIVNDLVYKNNKLIIPNTMKPRMLECIHSGHFGINKCIQRANFCLYWPRINLDIENYVRKCKICATYSNSKTAEPMIAHKIPNCPWLKLGLDIYIKNGKNYLIVVDYYSKYVEIEPLGRDSTSENVIKKLKSIFARHGIPRTLITDSGTQLTSITFKKFANEWNFNHITSSPHHQQSNGQVERTIQTVKRMIQKSEEGGQDFYLALLSLRNTPVYDSYSPSQLLMSRYLRDNLPLRDEQLKPKIVNQKKYLNKMQNSRKRGETYYNRGKRTHSKYEINDKIMFQKYPKSTWTKGKIVKRVNDRTYDIRTCNNKILTRNSLYIKHDYASSSDSDASSEASYCSYNDDVEYEVNPDIDVKPKINLPLVTTQSGRLIRPVERYGYS